eukprot:gnl/Chilomastix_cuspidata/1829.p2 GENE.gnl/Chilomastix_cuspidata/1829~~gnl/Chilomastix_cuspidata/1829.p2  ORF type:complete len:321 (+),score=156.78 gnl/Chilomastix_cuspidata/1829:2344-3306(+)
MLSPSIVSPHLRKTSRKGYYCPNCKAYVSTYIRNPSDGSILCQCGCILSERTINQTSEWRNFDSGVSDRARAGAGADSMSQGKSLSTKHKIVTKGADGVEKTLVTHSKANVSQADRQIERISMHMRMFAQRLGKPPRICDKGAAFFKEMTRKQPVSFKGQNMKTLSAALFFLAAQASGEGIRRRLYASSLGIDIREFNRACKFVQARVKLTPDQQTQLRSFVAEYALALTLPRSFSEHVSVFTSRVARSGVQGGAQNSTVAAACMLICCERAKDSSLARTLRQISNASSLSEEAIRRTYTNILSKNELLAQLDADVFERP